MMRRKEEEEEEEEDEVSMVLKRKTAVEEKQEGVRKECEKEGSNGHVWIGIQSEGHGAFFFSLLFFPRSHTLCLTRTAEIRSLQTWEPICNAPAETLARRRKRNCIIM